MQEETYICRVTTIDSVQVTKTRSRDIGSGSRVIATLAFLSIVRGTRGVSGVGGFLITLGAEDGLVLHEFLQSSAFVLPTGREWCDLQGACRNRQR